MGRGRRHLDHALLAVDVGGWDGRSGAEVPGDEHDALVGELVGDGHRLLRVAGVVADLQYELLPENPAGRVDVGDRHLGAGPHLRAETRILTGHRTGRGDHDIGPCRRSEEHTSELQSLMRTSYA